MLKAFTLIELLIVVAIIAILAAIAVPNFLEAQVRAKVSRAKADMRTLATGLESYAVDANKVMTTNVFGFTGFHINDHSVINAAFQGATWNSARFIRLTTPIAYITSVLVDPFALSGFSNAPNGDLSTEYDTYDYFSAYDLGPGGILDSGAGADWRGAGVTSGAGWRLASAGPDKIQAFGAGYVGASTQPGAIPNYYGVDYDATNGSISRGDIIRVGGGVGPSHGTNRSTPAIDRVQNRYNEAGL